MYKDKLGIEPINTGRQISEIVEMEEISKNKVAGGIRTDTDTEPEVKSGSELKQEPEIESELDMRLELESNSG